MWGPGYGYGYGMMMGGGFGWLLMLLLLIMLGALVLGLFRSSCSGRHCGRAAANEARAILDARYARGEIDADEYKRRRADLDA